MIPAIPANAACKSQNWEADIASELVLVIRILSQNVDGVVLRKIRRRVENGIADEFVRSPVDRVRTRLAGHVYNTAGEPAILCAQVIRLDFKFLNDFLGGQ